MKKIMIFASLLAVVACTEVEPMQVDTPQRSVNTQALAQYKANLSSRQVTMGALYNWGKEAGAILMNMPDSLDIVIVKDNYNAINGALKNDLSSVQSQKATKVLIGVDFTGINTTTAEVLSKQATDAVAIAKANGFNGVSIEFPQAASEFFSATSFNTVLTEVAKAKGDLLLVYENPYEQASTLSVTPNWVVYRKKNNELLKSFTLQAAQWANVRYLPSADLSEDSNDAGFTDSELFAPDGKDGRLPRTTEIIKWKSSNKGGVALYHIEKDYYNQSGKATYKNLRKIISEVQKQ